MTSGIELLKNAVLGVIRERPGIETTQITAALDLHVPDNEYGMKTHYLTTSILALLGDKIQSTGGGGRGNRRRWHVAE